ncbi:T9SS type B sorting domain-containing protein [Winogradskyella jejuensis]|uniref:Gliding motility-associated C-terminal domain-containing protein n=1 Tax=Winogradskyella jejuensis TaxID=1089305 RepID=A0A1M5RXG6_9FLAO|nr:T9SS type B sorting domain-containing protein [Winogradskyella jejuensis]SHH31052.1 gliding motility-associated C-terminal domain-containing protein [Winogradskyella jejuensis]
MPNKNIFLLLFLSLSYLSFGQFSVPGGITCNQAAPICSDNSGTYVFENNTDNTTNINMQVGCLGDAPRPSWFFLQVDQTGDLAFTINQWQDNNNDGINNDGPGTGIDVDFIAWGPFASDTGNCNNININCPGCPDNTANPTFYPNDLDNSNIIDCSWSPQPTETLTINGAQSGEFYLLLIANYGNGPGNPGVPGAIEIVQTNFGTPGGGSTDCSIIDINGILGPDQNICDMSSIPLDANPSSDPTFVDYAWEFNDGTGFAPIPGTDGLSSISVSNAGEYQVTITDNLGGSDTDVIEITVTALPTVNTVDNQFICDANNDGFFDFDFTILDATIIGAQTNVDVTYHNSMNDAMNGVNPIMGLYTNATAYTAEPIFIRVENTINRDCASTGSFDINVFNSPAANPVDNQLICDDNNDGFWDFDLDALRPIVLGTQDPMVYGVSFHLDPLDANTSSTTNPLPNTFTNLVAYDEDTIWVRIENITSADANACFEVISFDIDVFNQPAAETIAPQLICDDNNDGFWDFDLDALRSIALGTQDPLQFEVSFHLDPSDSNTSSTTNPLPNTFTNLVAYQDDIIYVRVENVDNRECYDISQFLIDVFEQPTPSTYTYELCDDSTDGDDTNGFVDFPLTPTDIDSFVLNGQDPTQFTVTYHLNQNDADNNVGAITNLYTDDAQIIARVENNDNTDCYETVEVNLEVNALPVITNMVELLQCDDDTDGISNFNLTEAEVLISTNFANETFTYHINPADAVSGANAIINPTAYANTDPSSNPDILFVRVENNDTCFRVAQLDLFVSATQIPANIEILYEECDVVDVADADITNGITTFDFSDAEAQIRAQAGLPTGQNLTFTFYESEADALAELNAIPDISNHRNDASPFEQEIYVRVDSDVDNACVGLGLHVRLRTINPTPNLNPDPIILCDDVTVGDLSEEFDLTIREAFIFNGDTNVNATYHTTFAGANANDNSIPSPTTYNNTNPSETIFVRVTNTTTTCYAIVELNIQVNPLPDDSAVVTDFFECENNTDFVFGFDLESKTDEILNGQDPMEFTVTYHETQLDADNLTNPLASPYENTISNPQPIFVAITNNTTGCSISTISFNIDVQEGADATDILYEECDVVGDNDGFTQFDLASVEAEVLNGQDPTAFSIDFYDNFDDAFNNNLPERLPLLYENLTVNTQVIYARVSNNIRPDECFDIAEVTLQVNLLPIFDLEEEYILCLSSNDEATVDVPPVLDTGLSDTDYAFEWSLDGIVLPTETGSSLIPTQGGVYDVVVTDIATSTVTMCQNFDSALVIESGLPDTFDLEVTSQAFTGNNMIIATATGNSTYEFSLDNGPWELVGEFENVTGGEHTVYVRDVNGCGILSRDITVIDYPKFFTPNGDGNNDTWTIKGINTQPTAVIYIYDRYGKLLKQLSPTSPGWDGTFNGNRMPSSDYWFTLEYTEPTNNETRTFSAHFALKR